jgi:multiple antibiotic resistance protein
MDLLSAIILLLIVTDPLGNLPIVVTCLQGTRRPLFFVTREVILATLVLLFALFFGPWLLQVLDLSREALKLAGGIVLFLISIKLIFPSDTSWLGVPEGEEPLLFPLAVPLVAGPSAVATVMLFSAQHPDKMGVWVIAIIISMMISLITFTFAPAVHKVVGHRALAAFQRLMGMLLTVIATQMMITGIKEIFNLPVAGG